MHLGHPSPLARLSGVLRVMVGTALALRRVGIIGYLVEQECHRAQGTARWSRGASAGSWGASCGRDLALASWVLQTFYALGQSHHSGEQVYMTSWERAQAIGIMML